ncbi:MAG TPA: FAD-dependent oxidoreductase [Candidatus Hydrogenedens sp.]|nr:FAD-dependent oxidoreductase [Candidatus Hydrogenedens sp.]
MKRRDFLLTMGTSPILYVPSSKNNPTKSHYTDKKTLKKQKNTELMKADVVIIGGGTGGVACALSALQHGLSVIMTEETLWLGGQMTSQAVPPDENPWVEDKGSTERYKLFRNAIRDFYRKNYPLLEEHKNNPKLNPGNGNVSRICHEPRVSAQVIESILSPYISGKKLTVLKKHIPLSVETNGDYFSAVKVLSLETGNEIYLSAPYFIDATETGELLPLGKVEYVIGMESQKETHEPHAPTNSDPKGMQACTWCFAMDYDPNGDHRINKPDNYDFWHSLIPQLDPPWTGPLLSLTATHPVTLQQRTLPFDPTGNTKASWWNYRQILDKNLFDTNIIPYSITLVNWPQNDYFLGNIIENKTKDEDLFHERKAKELSLALFYWLQTEAPRPDGGTGWKGLRLRPDVTGTEDGFAMRPYIREARRIKAEFTICEQHIGKDARKELFKTQDYILPEFFKDTVGIGYYRIDLHPRTNGKNYFDVDSLPFQIPLGALIPKRVENMLPVSKNIGTTHITNGAYRLHHVEWHIGEAVGCLLAFCKQNNLLPRQVKNHSDSLEQFQEMLQKDSIPLQWDKEILQQMGKKSGS